MQKKKKKEMQRALSQSLEGRGGGSGDPREREAPAEEPTLMAGTLFSSFLMSSAQHRQLDRHLMHDLQSDSVWS